jgi:hypothetical protein
MKKSYPILAAAVLATACGSTKTHKVPGELTKAEAEEAAARGNENIRKHSDVLCGHYKTMQNAAGEWKVYNTWEGCHNNSNYDFSLTASRKQVARPIDR